MVEGGSGKRARVSMLVLRASLDASLYVGGGVGRVLAYAVVGVLNANMLKIKLISS